MKVERSYQEVIQLKVEANMFLLKEGFINEKGEWIADKPQTKEATALKNILKQIDKIMIEYRDELDNIKLDNCLVDEKTKAILKGADGDYMFSIEGRKKFKAALKTLLDKKVEVHARVISGSEISTEDYEMFAGILVEQK